MFLTSYCSVPHCFNYRTFSKDWSGVFVFQVYKNCRCSDIQARLSHFNVFAVASEDTHLAFTQGSGNSIAVSCRKINKLQCTCLRQISHLVKHSTKENSQSCCEGNQSLNLMCFLPAGAGQSTGDESQGMGSTGRPLSAVER